MTKFNRPGMTPRVSGPIAGPDRPVGRTHQGGEGFGRDLKSELFLLATTNLVSEDTFYENAKQRDGRFQQLVRQAAIADPDWTAGLLIWLRGPGGLRSAPIVGAAEFVKARLDAGPAKTNPTAWNGRRHDDEAVGLNRYVIDRVCQRMDEPGELIAYWTSRYGRKLPMAVKRGTADATERLASEYAVLKYDTDSHAYRIGDVLELSHPRSKAPWQGDLYKHTLDRRHGREFAVNERALPMVYAEHALREDAQERPELLLNPHNLKEAGFTWNDALSLGGSRVGKKRLWEALIDADALPYEAMLKNLRNLTQAGIDDAHASVVMQRLVDPVRVQRSRQLPLRFLSAYRAAGDDLRWAWPLESALDLSLRNVPQLDGRTLVLVDTSGSMKAPLSEKSELKRWDAAALFGIALGRRCMNADVVSFSSPVRNYYGYNRYDGTDNRPAGSSVVFPMTQGASLLSSLQRWQTGGYFLDGGTDTSAAVREHLKPHHDRLVIITDEQATHGVPQSVPDNVRTHTINLAGYALGHLPASAPNRWTFGGLTDKVFHVMMHVERAQDAGWPWEMPASDTPRSTVPEGYTFSDNVGRVAT